MAAQELVFPNLKKRQWHYLQSPSTYDMAPCVCGNTQTQWSEFEDHLWCAACEKDFIPQHNGIFGGPIPLNAAILMGLSFDKRNLVTGKIEQFDPEYREYFVVDVDGERLYAHLGSDTEL